MASPQPAAMYNNDKASEKYSQEGQHIQHSPVEDVEPELHFRTWLVLAACSFIWFSINMGVSATGFWLSATVADIGGADQRLWFAEGLLVLQVAITPIFGQISDFSGAARKWTACYLCCMGAVGFFIAASAHSMNPQGIAGACLFGHALVAYGPTSAIVSDVFPRRYRGVVQGILYAILSGGGLFADLVGGAFIAQGGRDQWRYTIYISAAMLVIGAILLAICYQPIPIPRLDGDRTFVQKLAALDWIGCGIFAVAVVTLLTAIIWGGNQYRWSSAHCIATLTIAGIAIVSLIVHQTFIKKDGMLNHRLFRNRNFAICVLAIFIEGVVYITLNIFLAVQVGTLFESRPVLLGLHFGVILIVSALASLGWGFYTRIFREVRVPLVWGFLCFAASAAGFSRLQPNAQGAAAAWGLCALVGFAFGGPQGLLISTAQLAVEPDMVGLATSHIIGFRSLGGAVGSTIAGAILTPKLTVLLPQRTAEAALAAGVSPDNLPAVIGGVLTAVPGVPIQVPGVSAAQIAAAVQGSLQGYADGLAYIYYSLIPWAVVAAIALMFLRSVRESMNWHVDRPVEKELAAEVAAESQPERR